MRHSLQVMLKDSVDHMHMVEDAEHDQAILEATARILVRESFDRASTNRIAEKAGVSVGSLYQYFPRKEALVAAVIDRHHQELMQIVRGALTESTALPMEQAVRKLVEVGIKAHSIDPKLHRVLTEQLPRTGRLKNVKALRQEGYTFFKAYLEGHRDEIRPVDLALAAFVCVTTIEALTHTAVLHHSEILSDEAIGALVDEATRLVVRYLQQWPRFTPELIGILVRPVDDIAESLSPKE